MTRTATSLVGMLIACTLPVAMAQLQPPRGLPGTTPVPAPSRTPAPAPAVPADPYQALTFFEGNWTIAGLPQGTQFDESCGWLSNARRHLVCRSRTESANGVHEGLGVFSYRASDGMYVYRSFDPNGDVTVLEGRPVGDRWQFSGTTGTGAAQRRTRLTIAPGGERSFLLSEEIATGNGPWQAQPQVRYVPGVRAALR
jgi:hypothetical protein